MVSFASAGRRLLGSSHSPAARERGSARVTDAELARRLRERAYLEGDFVLRSGSARATTWTSTGSRREPELLGELGERSLRRAEAGPAGERLAGPELGAVALAAAASLASGLPFLIVRKAAKGYGTEKLARGGVRAGEEVCLVEDVVTSGRRRGEAVEALREAGLECRPGRLRRRSGGGRGGRARRRRPSACTPLFPRRRRPRGLRKARKPAWLRGNRAPAVRVARRFEQSTGRRGQ